MDEQQVLTFSTPPPSVQAARLAMARLEQRLHHDTDPLAADSSLTSVALAFMALEAVFPAYPPLPEVAASVDPGADLAEALRHLDEAIAAATSSAEKLRYATAARDLVELL